MLITEMLTRNARMYGDEIALIEREPAKGKRKEITWKTFDEQTNRIADALLRIGVKKGDTVVHLMKNCLEWLPIYFGILRSGALAVPLNFRFDPLAVKRCIEIADAKAFFLGKEFVDHADMVRNSLKAVTSFVFVGPDEMRPSFAVSYEAFSCLRRQ